MDCVYVVMFWVSHVLWLCVCELVLRWSGVGGLCVCGYVLGMVVRLWDGSVPCLFGRVNGVVHVM